MADLVDADAARMLVDEWERRAEALAGRCAAEARRWIEAGEPPAAAREFEGRLARAAAAELAVGFQLALGLAAAESCRRVAGAPLQ